MNAITTPRYLLSRDAHICLVDGIFIFLDVKSDRYSCLERRHTQPFARLIGLEVPALPDEPTASPAEMNALIADLQSHGLITLDPASGKPAELIPKPAELKELYGYAVDEAPPIRAVDVLRFFKALIIVKTMLRFASFERNIARVRKRKERNARRRETDPASIAEKIEVYKILKPLFVTVRDQCVFNSFFLIEFLASYRIYPSWHFGVRLNPFYAHCWVQEGDTVYDDFADTVGQNYPIMKA